MVRPVPCSDTVRLESLCFYSCRCCILNDGCNWSIFEGIASLKRKGRLNVLVHIHTTYVIEYVIESMLNCHMPMPEIPSSLWMSKMA